MRAIFFLRVQDTQVPGLPPAKLSPHVDQMIEDTVLAQNTAVGVNNKASGYSIQDAASAQMVLGAKKTVRKVQGGIVLRASLPVQFSLVAVTLVLNL